MTESQYNLLRHLFWRAYGLADQVVHLDYGTKPGVEIATFIDGAIVCHTL